MEIIRLTPDNIRDAARAAAKIMAKGGIVVYPTDTVYGLGVDAENLDAIERLKDLKGRERKRPISIIVRDVKHMEACGVVDDAARTLADKYLPGALTLVLRARERIPADLTFNGGVGVRIPDHPFCLELAKAFGKPYTSTSANQAGMATPRTIDDLMWHFGPKVAEIALIVDAGELPECSPSTVVSVMGENPLVLREGVISKKELGL